MKTVTDGRINDNISAGSAGLTTAKGMLSRRDLIWGALHVAGLGLLPKTLPNATAALPSNALLLSSVADSADQHWWQSSTLLGPPQILTKLPSRGHGLAIHPYGKQLVLVGRRPASWLLVTEVQLATSNIKTDVRNTEVRRIAATPDRHYFGHAEYSAEGSLLFTTENDYRHGRGVIGIYDTRNFERIGEWPSGGVGPHEIKLLSGGLHVAVANGGILTHPERPREKLNIDTMAPNLSVIDLKSGQVVSQCTLPNPKMSIRHLDIANTGQIWIGCQYEGDSLQPSPLVAFAVPGKDLQWAHPQDLDGSPAVVNPIWRQLKGYCGSVCCHPNAPVTAVSSPRGNHVLLWNSLNGHYLRSFRLRDVCGLAADAQTSFLASTGKGEVWQLPAIGTEDKATLLMSGNARWDNHMTNLIL